MYSIKLLNFEYGMNECLQPLLVDVSSQAMNILQSFDEDSDGGSIIHTIASLSFCFEVVDVCNKGFLLSLLNLHEA